jgi:hypothetical protein
VAACISTWFRFYRVSITLLRDEFLIDSTLLGIRKPFYGCGLFDVGKSEGQVNVKSQASAFWRSKNIPFTSFVIFMKLFQGHKTFSYLSTDVRNEFLLKKSLKLKNVTNKYVVFYG